MRGPVRTLAALLVLLPGSVAWAAGVACRVERLGGRAHTHVAALDLFDRELLRLVQLGLVGRITIESVLLQRRRFWFDQRTAEATRTHAVAWSKQARRYTLDGSPLASPLEVRLPMIVLRPEDADLAAGDFYVEINLRLEVITAESLGQVARWLVRPRADQPGGAPALLPRAVVGYLAGDLARRATGRCPVPR